VQKDAHWIQLVKKQELLYVRLTPYSFATKPSSELHIQCAEHKTQISYLTQWWNRISSHDTGQESSCSYRISRPIRLTFFPEKCELNLNCVLCAEGIYFQTYKYPYIY
jgi:hypothetical protein